MEIAMNKYYKIDFMHQDGMKGCNWALISTIDKKTFYEFAEYLYSLKRDIVVVPYIPGGLVSAVIPHPELDRTYLVRRIANDIIANVPICELLNKYFCHLWHDIKDYNNPYNIFFIEDLFEYLLSSGVLTKDEACKMSYDLPHYCKKYSLEDKPKTKELMMSFIKWHDTHPTHAPYVGISRWNFIYMFRNEYLKYMDNKGYEVVVEGGWVLNDKKREIKLGLIDKEGRLL